MVSPLIVFAMEQERQDQFDDLTVLHSGIGKVNAAYALTKALADSKPDIVINMGTAGSRGLRAGSVVNPTRFVQRDMDVRFLGFDAFQTPFSDDPVEIDYGLAVDGYAHGVCGTGDNFDTSEAAAAFDVVDMEAYALSLICQREAVPFLCLKYISDGADDEADQDWNAALRRAASALRMAFDGVDLEGIVKGL